MRLRSFGIFMLLGATLSTSSGCFCWRPWGHCHHCGYESLDALEARSAVARPVVVESSVIAVPAR
jgi:hypothetical protein